nr:MAG: nonstructural protein [Microviridae sp.]
MIMMLFTIQDKVAEDTSPPFATVNMAVAKRQYTSLINELASDDYCLYYLGTYDTSTMHIDLCKAPEEVL